MAMHKGHLPRGKRRGDCQEFAELGYHDGAGDFYTGKEDVRGIVAEAKRRCLEPTPFSEWNRAPAFASNGYHYNLQRQEQQFLPDMQTGLPADAHMDMDLANGEIASNGHAINGFEHNHQDHNFCHHHQGGQQTDLKGDGQPAAAPVISYYGYIANYEHDASDVGDVDSIKEMSMNVLDSMDTELPVQTQYAIDGPSACIKPNERRVCLKCRAGEPGHITHIMHPC